MRAKCPKCGTVFELGFQPSLIHVGPWRFTKCPSCGKSSMMNNFVRDEVTWPPEPKPKDAPMTDEDLKKKRIEDSKSEEPDRDDRKDPADPK